MLKLSTGGDGHEQQEATAHEAQNTRSCMQGQGNCLWQQSLVFNIRSAWDLRVDQVSLLAKLASCWANDLNAYVQQHPDLRELQGAGHVLRD